jgi:ribose transport system permease protein
MDDRDVKKSATPTSVAAQVGATPLDALPVRKGQSKVGGATSRYALIGLMVVMIIGFSIARPDTFPTFTNLKVILTTQAVYAVLAMAMIFPLVVGMFDLSVGALAGICAVLTAGLTAEVGWPVPLAVVVAILIGLFVGTVNGLLVTRIGINALISTLGMSTLLYGLVLAYTGGATISAGVPKSLVSVARTQLFGIPLPVFYMILIGLICWYVLEKTPIGRYLYAIGGSKEAARLAGVNVKRLTFLCFLVAGGLAGVGGVITAARIGVGDPSVGPNFLLPVFAAALLGAATIKPGIFNIAGTIVAVFTLAVGVNGLQLLGVPFWIDNIFNGLALIIAVGLTRYLQREEL